MGVLDYANVSMVDEIGVDGLAGADVMPDNFNLVTHFYVETKRTLSVGD